MKHLLFIYLLAAAALSMPVFAQDSDSSLEDSVAQFEENLDKGVKVDLDFKYENEGEKKIKSIVMLVSKFDQDAAKELELELGNLSDEEKAELFELFEGEIIIDGDIDRFPIGIVFIAVPAIVLVFGMPLFLLIALLAAGNRKRKQKMELVDLYIKNDRDIPEHVLNGLDNGGSASSLKSGLTLTAIGLGIVAALNVVGADELAGFGLIPMFLGIARLIFWFLVEKKVEAAPDANHELSS
ncbi:MAG: hypothetical protein ACI854_000996 [Arenicella sp.]|jgi:hypothetical protein